MTAGKEVPLCSYKLLILPHKLMLGLPEIGNASPQVNSSQYLTEHQASALLTRVLGIHLFFFFPLRN